MNKGNQRVLAGLLILLLIATVVVILAFPDLIAALLGTATDACTEAYRDENGGDASWAAPSSSVICRVVIKAGNQSWTLNGNGCQDPGYCANGIGSQSATGYRICDEGPACPEISHVEFYTSLWAAPTEEPTEEPTSTPEPDLIITVQETATPEPSPEGPTLPPPATQVQETPPPPAPPTIPVQPTIVVEEMTVPTEPPAAPTNPPAQPTPTPAAAAEVTPSAPSQPDPILPQSGAPNLGIYLSLLLIGAGLPLAIAGLLLSWRRQDREV